MSKNSKNNNQNEGSLKDYAPSPDEDGITSIISFTNNMNSKKTMDFMEITSRPLELVFQHIWITIDKRDILKDVSGMVQPGEMLAVMGPSGSGKTTLLNCLGGRLNYETGIITLNDERLSKQHRRKIAYVLQQDIFFTNLTLFQTIKFAALLRLPDKMPYKEKMDRVERLIDILDLRKCINTKIGNNITRGLSGGEMKRANIACELITDPMLMLLDEPTSGLDSSTAYSLMSTLKMYAEQERKTVVATIHQPSSQIFHMFDRVLLMCNGQVAYFGNAHKIIDFFENIGLHCVPHYNPADFILEQTKSEPEIQEQIIAAAKELKFSPDYPEKLRRRQSTYVVEKANGGLLLQGDHRILKYDTHGSALLLNKDLDDLELEIKPIKNRSPRRRKSSMIPEIKDVKWVTSFWTQFNVLLQRNFIEASSRIVSKLGWVQNVSISVLAGILWFQLPKKEEKVRDITGILYFCPTYWMFFTMFNAITAFPAERIVINKERSAGSYRLSAYYLAKTFSELPLVFCLPIVFHIIVYIMAGLNGTKAFFGMLGSLLLNVITSQGCGLLIGASCMNLNVSLTVAAVFALAILLFGGFYASNLPYWTTWMKYLSFNYFVFQSWQILEFTNADPYLCAANNSLFGLCYQPNVTHFPSEHILIKNDVHVPLWSTYVILLGFCLFFRILCYIVLRYLRKPL